MRSRRIGRTRCPVSELALGTWHLARSASDAAGFIRVVQAALNVGINCFDTAASYSAGLAESLLGDALKNHPRDQYVLCTKAGLRVDPDDAPQYSLTWRAIVHSLETSLSRLGTDYIDVLQLYRCPPGTLIEEVLSATEMLIKAGKVLQIGLCDYSLEMMDYLIHLCTRRGWAQPSVYVTRLNLLDRYAVSSLIEGAAERGLATFAYSPLAEGVLTGKYAHLPAGLAERVDIHRRWGTSENEASVRRLVDLSSRLHVSPQALALQWVCRMRNVVTTVIGPRTVGHLMSYVSALDADITELVLAQL